MREYHDVPHPRQPFSKAAVATPCSRGGPTALPLSSHIPVPSFPCITAGTSLPPSSQPGRKGILREKRKTAVFCESSSQERVWKREERPIFGSRKLLPWLLPCEASSQAPHTARKSRGLFGEQCLPRLWYLSC